MRVAFFAPMKPPDHPVPSGDRQMARLLMRAMERAGFSPELASRKRFYLKEGDVGLASLRKLAEAEVERLLQLFTAEPDRKPALWFTYHPYYKSPDLVGPEVSRRLNIPYVTAEASWSRKRAEGRWQNAHAANEQGLLAADLHLCLTGRDRAGLAEFLGGADRCADFPPFIDLAGFEDPPGNAGSDDGVVRLLTVAMMRADVKFESYRMLAEVLAGLQELPWELQIAGDGEARADVEAAFASIDPRRLTWHGKLEPGDLTRVYHECDLYVWPGFGEAFGMAFLEAQAGGLPVIAQDTKGIPSVVLNGQTGLLTPENDVEAFRAAIRRLIEDVRLRSTMSLAAREFVWTERSLEKAASRLKQFLGALV